MLDEFVPLELFLRPAPPQEPPVASEPPAAGSIPRECEEAIRAARLFRAALADAVDVALARLLPEIARSVLGRELRLERANVGAIVADRLARESEKALALRAHSADVEALAALEVPVAPDDSLQRGDAVLELRSGTIDLRMETRLDAILRTWT